MRQSVPTGAAGESVLFMRAVYPNIGGSEAAFRERAPWWGGDLQTLRNLCLRRHRDLAGTSSAVEFPMADGSGDRLLGTLTLPDAPRARGPLIVLIHGLTGCEDSDYMRESARFHLARGRSVLRLNLRGAGPGRDLARGYYHAGCADDLQAVLDGLDAALSQHGLFLIGYSLGGNILLNWLGRADARHPVIGAATVSAPIEPGQACRRILQPRNALYHHFLIRRMKRDVLASDGLLPVERRNIESARTIFEFDDRWVAPRNGFRGAKDYYARTAGAQFVPSIAVPTLMIHARNDPWIPDEPYLRLAESTPPPITLLLPGSGGHLGFHEQGHAETWHDRAIDRFLRDAAGSDGT